MPRFAIRRKEELLTAERSIRSKRRQVFGYREWRDPHPDIIGTRPEKMIYAELVKRNIPFMYQTWFRVFLPDFGYDKYYLPDFVLPTHKIIIEVQGAYWHSQPEQIEKDAFKQALYILMGYKVLAWWDYDIEHGVDSLFASEPRLGYYLGNNGGRIITKDQVIRDDSAGVRIANKNRTDLTKRRINVKTSKKVNTRTIF